MPENNFCPFLNGVCNEKCVFYRKIARAMYDHSTSHCLVFIKLSDINEMQHDDLTELINK